MSGRDISCLVGQPCRHRQTTQTVAERSSSHKTTSRISLCKDQSAASSASFNPYFFPKVIGVPGGDLNYAETVVYANDAIRPAYILVYGDPPKARHDMSNFKALLSTLFHTPLVS